MDIVVIARQSDAVAIRQFAVRRVHFVLRRIAWLVRHARVELQAQGCVDRGRAMRCEVTVEIHDANRIVVTSFGSDWRQAFDAALARAARLATRAFRRTRAQSAARP